jgi:hypothetical protein
MICQVPEESHRGTLKPSEKADHLLDVSGGVQGDTLKGKSIKLP